MKIRAEPTNEPLPSWGGWMSWPWRKRTKPLKPSGPIISAAECKRILERRFKSVEVWDRDKDLADVEIAKRVLIESGVPQIVYVPKRKDCENLAAKAHGELQVDDRTCHMAIFKAHVVRPDGKHHMMMVGIGKDGLFLLERTAKSFPMSAGYVGRSARA